MDAGIREQETMVMKYQRFWKLIFVLTMGAYQFSWTSVFNLLAADFAGDAVFAPAIETMRLAYRDGISISEAMAKTGIFSEYEILLIKTGEDQGNPSIRVREIIATVAIS